MTIKGSDTSVTEAFIRSMRVLRKQRKLSVQDVSDKLATAGHIASRQSLNNFECRRTLSVSLDVACGIAAVLGVTLSDMLAGVCERCSQQPPAGFTCNACGAEGA